MEAPMFFTVREAAAALRVSQSLLRNMIRRGRLPARRLRGGRLLRIARADLEGLLESLPPRESTREK